MEKERKLVKREKGLYFLTLGMVLFAAALALGSWGLLFYRSNWWAAVDEPPLDTPTPEQAEAPPSLEPRPTGTPSATASLTPSPTPLPTSTSNPPTLKPTVGSPSPKPAAGSGVMVRLLRQLTDLSALSYPEGTTSRQFTSFNHSSPERFWDYFTSDEMFSQDARYGYLVPGGAYARYRVLAGPGGRKEYEVLPRTEGPGYVARVWFGHRQHDRPNPGEKPDPEWGFFGEVGNIRFYFDDEPAPRIDMPVTQFFSGRASPFLSPLVGHYRTANGGNYSYVPMPFHRSVRATISPNLPLTRDQYVGPRMFQILVKRFDRDPGLFPSFRPNLSAEELAELDRVRHIWNSRGSAPYGQGSGQLRQSLSVEPGKPAQLELPGPGIITSLRITVPQGQENDVTMHIYWDGEAKPSVEGPLRALFGTAEETRHYQALPMGMKALSGLGGGQSEFYSFFPMPYRSGRLRLEKSGSGPSRLEVAIQYAASGSPPSWRFHAQHRQGRKEAGDSANYRAVEVGGSGRLMGIILTMEGLDRGGRPYYNEPLPDFWHFPYLEGNLHVWVDGELTVPGTGIEDDFNAGFYYAWYDPSNLSFTQYPLAGCLWKGYRVRGEVASQYRFYLTDSAEFKRSLAIEVEHGIIGNNLSVSFSSTVFWYQ